MGALFIFIFILILVFSALLFFNKGEKAQEIKSSLKDIYESFKDLFSNLKKLFLILKDLIQAKSDPEPTQLKGELSVDYSSNDSSKSQIDSVPDPQVTSEPKSEAPSLDSMPISTDSQTEPVPDPQVTPEPKSEAPSLDSMPNNSTDSKNE